jgi:hypothetical protein
LIYRYDSIKFIVLVNAFKFLDFASNVIFPPRPVLPIGETKREKEPLYGIGHMDPYRKLL